MMSFITMQHLWSPFEETSIKTCPKLTAHVIRFLDSVETLVLSPTTRTLLTVDFTTFVHYNWLGH